MKKEGLFVFLVFLLFSFLFVSGNEWTSTQTEFVNSIEGGNFSEDPFMDCPPGCSCNAEGKIISCGLVEDHYNWFFIGIILLVVLFISVGLYLILRKRKINSGRVSKKPSVKKR
jgi:hypothetical protein